tara:strand:- start:1669 stop:1968 length:300 start_codon:yes stop_codon:yes gene_type:complete
MFEYILLGILGFGAVFVSLPTFFLKYNEYLYRRYVKEMLRHHEHLNNKEIRHLLDEFFNKKNNLTNKHNNGEKWTKTEEETEETEMERGGSCTSQSKGK